MIALYLKEIFLSPVGAIANDEIESSFVSKSTKEPGTKVEVLLSAKMNRTENGILIDLGGRLSLSTHCDRCLKKITTGYNFKSDLEIKNQDVVHLKNYQYPLEELLNEQILLNQPIKELCRDDCKGLCANCGNDNNIKKCDCKPFIEINSPFVALKGKKHGPAEKKNKQ